MSGGSGTSGRSGATVRIAVLAAAVLTVAAAGTGTTHVASAQDSVIGLPAPRDPEKPGAVLLHGGGWITQDAFDRFVELAGGPQARIVLVPSAGYRRADYDDDAEYDAAMRRRFSSWVRLVKTGRARSVKFLSTDDPDDADDEDFVRPLRNATGVWFCGGDQARLNYRFVGGFPRRTLFQESLREVLERGGVVGGTSAGMAALPVVMTIREVKDDDDDEDGPFMAVARHGLGLFDRAIVEQHFDRRNGRLERFLGLLRDSFRLDEASGMDGVGARMLGLAVEENAGLVVRGDRLEVVGSRSAHVFLKTDDDESVVWRTLRPGDTGTLRRDATGQAVLHRDPRPAR